MTRLDWIVIAAVTAAPWLALLVAVQVSEWRRKRSRRRRGGVLDLRRIAGENEQGFGHRRAGS